MPLPASTPGVALAGLGGFPPGRPAGGRLVRSGVTHAPPTEPAPPPPTAPSVPAEPKAMSPRVLGGIVMAVAMSPLAIGAGLSPASEGHGTHTQMGLPSCSWVMAFQRPCPTCGMTTAVTHAAHGDLLGAVLTQPAGATFAVLLAVAFWCGLHGLISGANTVRLAGGLFKGRTWWVIGGILLAAWAYKMVTFEGTP